MAHFSMPRDPVTASNQSGAHSAHSLVHDELVQASAPRGQHYIPRLAHYIETQRTAEKRTLRDGQIDVFPSALNSLSRGVTSGYIQLPTRVGKSVVMAKFAEALGGSTLILVPSRPLARHMFSQLTTFAPGIDTALQYGEHKGGWNHQVVISTYQYYLKALKDQSGPSSRFDFVFLDEAHESLSGKRRPVVEQLKKESIVWGFSATPEYDSERNLKKVLGEEIHRMSISEAVALRLLPPFRVMTVETDIDLGSVGINYGMGDYSAQDLNRVLNTSSLTQGVIQLYRGRFDGEKGIIFCSGVTHAEDVAAAFNEAGISAAAITRKVPGNVRDELIAAHKDGELKILTNAQILRRGYDNCRMTFTFNMTPTMSLVTAEQRGGRPLTIDSNQPDKIATIVEFLHRDPARRRRQMTYVDVVHAAYIEAPATGSRSGPRGENEKNYPVIPGLKVSLDSRTVLDVVKRLGGDTEIRRTGPRGQEKSDKIVKVLTSALRETEKSLFKLPMATALMLRLEKENEGRESKQVIQLLGKALERIKDDFRRISTQEIRPEMLRIFESSNKELLLHVLRKFPETKKHVKDMELVRFEMEDAYLKLQSYLSLIESVEGASGIGEKILAAYDTRISTVPDEELIPPDLQFEYDVVVEDMVKPLLNDWERQNQLRWDMFLDIHAEVRERRNQVLLMQAKLEHEGLRLARRVARQFVDQGMDYQDLIQEASLAVIGGTEKFVSMTRARPRYDSFIKECIQKHLRSLLQGKKEHEEIPGTMLQSDLEREGVDSPLVRYSLRRRSMEERSSELQDHSAIESPEQRNSLEKLLERVPLYQLIDDLRREYPRHMEALELNYGLVDASEGYPCVEIGKMLNISKGRAATLVAKGRELLLDAVRAQMRRE